MKTIKENKVLFFAIFLFLILTTPFVNTIPFLDGNIDFIKTTDFYGGGLEQYFANWNTVHPPFKLFLIYPFYFLFGISVISYSTIGIIIGILGIITFFLLTSALFEKKVSSLATLLFSVSPLMVSNSIFMTIDYLLTNLIIISIYFYQKEKYFFYFLFSSFAVLTKETGLIFPAIFLIIEVFYLIKNGRIVGKNLALKFVYLTLPFGVFYVWKTFLDLNNKLSWSEWIFTDTKTHGAFYTIFNNVLTLNFFNPYGISHWKELFFLNFNWIYLLVIVVAFLYVLFFRKKDILTSANKKIVLSISIFSIIYLFTILTFQTYTIPRYALPIIPFLIIITSRSVFLFKNSALKISLILTLILFTLFALFFSLDPVATRIWGKTKIFDQEVYALNKSLAGNDGITYNIQYLFIASARSKEILKANKENKNVTSNYCQWIFPDPSNDIKMLKALNLKIQPKCFYSN